MTNFKNANVKLITSAKFAGNNLANKNGYKRNNEQALYAIHHLYNHNNATPISQWLNSQSTQVNKALITKYLNSLELPFLEYKKGVFNFVNNKPIDFDIYALLPFGMFEEALRIEKEAKAKAKAKEKNSHKLAVSEERKLVAEKERKEKAIAAAKLAEEKAALIAKHQPTKDNQEKAAKLEKERKEKEKAAAKLAKETEIAAAKAVKTEKEYFQSLGELSGEQLANALKPLVGRGLKCNDRDQLKSILAQVSELSNMVSSLLADTVPSAEVDSVAFDISNAIKPTTKERAAGKKSVA